MKSRKFLAGFVSAVLVASVIAGCATTTTQTQAPAPAAQEPEKKVEIEFWGWWSSATRMPTINKIVGEWNAKNPNIQVKYTAVPFGDILTKYLAAVAAGNTPDVVAVPDIFTTPLRGQKKQALDLSTVGGEAMASEFYPEFWKAVLYQGKPYGLPWVGETKFMYINNDHFKEAGLDATKDAPKTWDDLWKLSDKLDKREGAKVNRAGFHPLFGNFGYRGWVWNAQSAFFDNRNFPTVNTDKNVEVMDWIKKWTDRYTYEGYSSLRGSFGGGANHPFITGKVSMIIETATWEGELKRNGPNVKYTVIPVPTPNGQQHAAANYTGGFAVEIPAATKHPKQAFAFAKYWATEAAVIWATEQNDFPAYNKAVEKITTPEFKRAVDNMKYTAFVPLPLTALTYNDAIENAVTEVVSGKKDSKKALGDAQGAIVKMVQESTSK